MKTTNLIAIFLIFTCSTAAWFLLGGSIDRRSNARSDISSQQVEAGWGPPMRQMHPIISYRSPTARDGRRKLQPARSDVTVRMAYEPKRKGLLWHRTYLVEFVGDYVVSNPTPVTQTLFVEFHLPSTETSFYNFSYQLGEGDPSGKAPENGVLTEAVVLPAGATTPLKVTYQARGTDQWRYAFGDTGRVQQFRLMMQTDFETIDFPAGTGSPTARAREDRGWQLEWFYPDVLDAQAIGMAMPKALNPGPVASRIAFYAPVSLLFFFAVLLLLGMRKGVVLHPMHYFFVATGFFAFPLLFAYLVDHAPLHLSFVIAATTSLVLVVAYTHAVSRGRLTALVIPAQIAYMVLFSYSFFFDGLTGLVITIGAIITLALLMTFTARIDWSRTLQQAPPPIPRT